jgi:hypothetical protein
MYLHAFKRRKIFGLYSVLYIFCYGRIRGLQPNCEYRVGLKASKSNIHVERTIPALHTVKVSLLGLLICVSGLDSLNLDQSFLLNAMRIQIQTKVS